MFKHCPTTVLLTIMALLHYNILLAQDENSDTSCDIVYDIVLVNDVNSPFAGIEFYQSDVLVNVYEKNACQALWYNENLAFSQVKSFVQRLNDVGTNAYHKISISERLSELESFYLPQNLFDFNGLDPIDILLTDAAIQYAYDLWQDATVTKGDKSATLMVLTTAVQEALINNKLQDLLDNLAKGRIQALQDKIDAYEAKQVNDMPEPATEVPATTTDETVDNADVPSTEMVELNTIDEEKPIVINDSSLFNLVGALLNSRDSTLFAQQVQEQVEIADFYSKNDFTPIWHNGETTYGITAQLLRNIELAGTDGLTPDTYNFKKLLQLYEELDEVYLGKYMPYKDFLTKYEVLLTDAAFTYGHDLMEGERNPESLKNYTYHIPQTIEKLSPILQEALDQNSVDAYFMYARPQHPMYKKLRQALVTLQQSLQTNGDWPLLSAGTKLELGVRNNRVLELRKRLNAWPPNTTDSIKQALIDPILANTPDSSLFMFDSLVYKAVHKFQRLHGLVPDGIVGNQTIGALNVSKEARIKQIELNLERWRWLPSDMGDRYILVNIPAFKLYVTEKNHEVGLTKLVMVGKKYTATPVFVDEMEYIEFNPYWTVPYSIATGEILPKLKRNGNYLAKNNMQLLSGSRVVSSRGVDWSRYGRGNFPFKIRQKPGPKNALGIVKFMFPNRFSIYIHDTPSKSLFVKSSRAFSHGCIRLHKPVELAEYLLSNSHSPKDIQKILKKGKNKRVTLPQALPVYIVYFTTWVNDEGELQFSPDIYARDKAMEAIYNNN